MYALPSTTIELESAAVAQHQQRLQDALERHDPGSAAHAASVARLSGWLARELGFGLQHASALERAAAWHDIGKLAVPSSCLQKPGALDEREWHQIRQHPWVGSVLLAPHRFPDLELDAQVALEHHERYDGGGYPRGLVGDGISLAARIVAVADVFDALASARCYKLAWPPERIEQHFRAERARGFDPEVTDVLCSKLEQAYIQRRGTRMPTQSTLRLCA